MQFVDQALIHVKAGDGGKGAVAFRREKFVPKGGPSGGDGGSGGSVVLVVDEGLSTLLDFRYKKEYQAPSGESGSNKDKYGRGGADLVLRVPPGTEVNDQVTGARIADLHTHGERFVLAQGGKGGRGNIHFATSTDRAPRRFEPGLPGDERAVRLDLKLLADVGLLGFPNVGKSSLIARISAARPKIADYPFTTLVPNLGMVRLSGERSFVVADIPGLIEGAHEGLGLGDRFLRHVERTRVLVHLLDATAAGPDRAPLKDFDAINRELALFDPALATRPQIVVLNKKDLPDVESVRRKLTTSFARRKIQLLAISAATGDGVQALLEAVWKVIEAQRKKVSTGAAPTPLDQSDSSPHLVRPKELTPRSRPARTASTRPPRGPGRPRER
ncbi:MAG TPA: GTPase ObgE [Polyangia bacterium]|jgi:GTP-binding protein|nr:GTPase ObgE [Polyangia bacterium]